MNTALVGGVLLPSGSGHRGSAPPSERRGGVDREHRDPAAGRAERAYQRGGHGGLPDARRAGQPDDPRLAVLGQKILDELSYARGFVLDRREQPGQGAGVPGQRAVQVALCFGHVF